MESMELKKYPDALTTAGIFLLEDVNNLAIM